MGSDIGSRWWCWEGVVFVVRGLGVAGVVLGFGMDSVAVPA
jgi:hypothetical protein